MSDSDWEMAECAPGEPDDDCLDAIEEVFRLLDRDGPLWAPLMITARRLIVESRDFASESYSPPPLVLASAPVHPL